MTSVSFNLPPAAALEFFRAKGLAASFAWQDLLREEHSRSFTVAKMMDMALLADVQTFVDMGMAQGWTNKQFADQLTPLLIEKGWWGKQEITDPATGATVLAQLGSPRRLRTIFDTNLSTSYAAGHWAAIAENAWHRPWLRYVAIEDDRTREQHAAWHGTLLRWDDPWWDTHYPPNGWHCRCSVIAQTDRDLQRLGLKPTTAPDIKTRAWLNPRTGETSQVPLGIDAGWDYHVGKGGPQSLARAALDSISSAPAPLGAAANAQIAPHIADDVLADFGAWVTALQEAGLQASGSRRIVGAMSPLTVEFLALEGVQPASASLTIADSDLAHLLRDAKQQAQRALPVAVVKELPLHMAAPQAVLFDTQEPALIYVIAIAGDARAGKLVVRVNYSGKSKQPDGKRQTVVENRIRTGGLVPYGDLQKGGRYRLIEGVLQP